MTAKTLDLKKLKGYQTRTVSIKHLPELQEDVEKLKQRSLLDEKFAEDCLKFNYDIDATLPGAQFLIIMSTPQPITRAIFNYRGKGFRADIPPTYIWKSENTRAQNALSRIVEPAGYKLARVWLPVKTLAVRSGLAQYGMNNITYVAGYGSFQRLAVFVTDGHCDEDSWGELKAMQSCESCSICRDNCPTHCIPTDRFLLHAENCLTRHNELEAALPDWIKPDWHNALIGCMRCQLVCPVNKKQLDNIAPGPVFSAEETELILQKQPMNSLPEGTRRKIAEIAMDDSSEVLGRNLELLIKQ
jgi:epoxyqueuosine reductase